MIVGSRMGAALTGALVTIVGSRNIGGASLVIVGSRTRSAVAGDFVGCLC